MIVPFVHDKWVIGWLMQKSATVPLMAGRFVARARRARDPRVARVREGRQTAITSTTRAREPKAGIPQVGGFMRIGLSFLLGSDSSQQACRVVSGPSKEVSRRSQIHSMATS